MKTTPSFSLSIDRSGGYNVLHINLYADRELSSPHRAASIRFQATATAPADWYGSMIKIEADSFRELEEHNRLLARLFRPSKTMMADFNLNGNVLETLQLLLRKADECVYDCRVSKLVPLRDVLPPDFAAYRDDWNAYGSSSDGCCVGCVARDDDEARRILTKEFADLTYRKERFDQWLSAGRPVKRLTHHYEAPIVAVTADELIAEILKSKQVEAA